MKSLLVCLCTIFIFSIDTIAQDLREDSLQYQMDSVVISAGRFEQPLHEIPFSIDVMDQSTLRLSHESLSSEDLFRYVPGVVVNNRNNLSQGDRISIRGIGSRSQFGVRGIKVLLDDIPLTLPDGQSDLNNLDVNSIGRIEVIKGPSSFLYGNSSGGVIYIQSNNLSPGTRSITPRMTVGSYGLQKYSLSASEKIGGNSLFISIYTSAENGFRDHSAARSTDINIISEQQMTSQLSLKAVVNYYDAPFLLNPSSLSKSDAVNNPSMVRSFVVQQGSGKKVSQGQAGISGTYSFDDDQKIEATVYGITRSMRNPIPGQYIELDRRSGGVRTNYSDSFTASDLPFHLLAGGDLEFQQDGRKEFENNGLSAADLQTASNDEIIGKVRIGKTLTDQDERVTAEGLFTKVECSPFALLTLMGGVRYDRYIFTADDKFLSDGVDNSGSVAMGNLSRMIGATYVFDDHHQVFANYSTSFEVPTTTELGNTPTGEGGFNTSLRPEHIVSLEGGVRGDVFVDAIRYSVSVYRMMIDGILIPYQIPNQPGDVLYYKNAGSAVNTGVECSLIWKPLTGIAITAVVSHMNFVYDSYLADATINGSIVQVQLAGNTIPGVPQDDIDLGVEYDFPFGLSAEFYTNRTGRMYGNDLNGPDSPTGNPSDFINDPFTTSQLKLDYTVVIGSVHANLFAGISNIFDARYNGSVTPNAAGNRFFEPSPPRNWYAGISMIFE